MTPATLFDTQVWQIARTEISDPQQYQDLRQTNDERYLDSLDAIRSGQAAGALSPFAKAYLGLFLDIPGGIEPPARVYLLANDRLADAVLQGFCAILNRGDLPSANLIGTGASRQHENPAAYVVLAGMDFLAERSMNALRQLPPQTLAAALCFHFSHAGYHHAEWVDYLITQRQEITITTLRDYWLGLVGKNAKHLPGLQQILTHPAGTVILKGTCLTLLHDWHGHKISTFKELLLFALHYEDRQSLTRLTQDKLAQAGSLPLTERTYWMTTRFLLAPSLQAANLADYAVRSKEKILPLLDFAVAALKAGGRERLQVPPQAIAQLLRIIAPVFRRNVGRLGLIDETSTSILWLFDQLGNDSDPGAAEALSWLRQVRVMRMYEDVMNEMIEKQAALTETPAEPAK